MKVSNHYQAPLPLKNTDVKLPNRKKQLLKDGRFLQQYTEFMHGILEKGYAK